MRQVTEIVEPGPSASSLSTSPRRPQVEFAFIPSSQTQILDSLFEYETVTPTCTLEIPLANVPIRNQEPTVPYSESALSSQSYFVSPDLDDFIASSQSQPLPTSPIDFEIELVPSSQTQELFHSQRTGLYLSQEDGPKPRCSQFDGFFLQF
jgi:hypothetical protein